MILILVGYCRRKQGIYVPIALIYNSDIFLLFHYLSDKNLHASPCWEALLHKSPLKTLVLCRFKPCSQHVGDSLWCGCLTMVLAGDKSKLLSSVKHTTKTIHHHHRHHHHYHHHQKSLTKSDKLARLYSSVLNTSGDLNSWVGGNFLLVWYSPNKWGIVKESIKIF